MLVIPSTMTMLSNFAPSARLPALVTVVHVCVTVVEIIDGSMSFARRAGGKYVYPLSALSNFLKISFPVTDRSTVIRSVSRLETT